MLFENCLLQIKTVTRELTRTDTIKKLTIELRILLSSLSLYIQEVLNSAFFGFLTDFLVIFKLLIASDYFGCNSHLRYFSFCSHFCISSFCMINSIPLDYNTACLNFMCNSRSHRVVHLLFFFDGFYFPDLYQFELS